MLGGGLSLIGALCYAELATAFPNVGGEYHYLRRAFGDGTALLFGWSRAMVIQTGSIASLAYVLGDYMSAVVSLGPHSSAFYAGLSVLALTWINAEGVRPGMGIQNLLALAKLGSLVAIGVAGMALLGRGGDGGADGVPVSGSLGLALVFVLYTYGGWNEVAYISAEVRDRPRGLVKALVGSIGILTAMYCFVNGAYLWGLGLEGIRSSEVVAASLLEQTGVSWGRLGISVLIVIAALGAINGTIITGARTLYAMGRDFPLFASLGQWEAGRETPRRALWVQMGVVLALIGFGAWKRHGFEAMVAYTSPVFWFFFLLTGLTLFIFRATDPQTPRPFLTPFYPLPPLIFCAVGVYMLHSSLAYAASVTVGNMVKLGIGVLLVGIPLLLWTRKATLAQTVEPPRKPAS
jgi:amino acid transporter